MSDPQIVLCAYLLIARNVGAAFLLWGLAAWAMREGRR